MATKKYQVAQTCTVNGKRETSTFIMYGEQDDVTSLCALLEGGYEVKEVNTAMSDMSKADTNVAVTNPVNGIFLSGEKNQFASIRPFKGQIHFQNNKSVDDIVAVLKTTTPFELLPTAKPLRISVKRSESISVTAE